MLTRTLAFHADGLVLEGELVLPAEPTWVLVLAHGIPGGGPPDPSDGGYPGLAREFAARGFGAVWFNFRGCRGAPGEFSMHGWVRDLHAVLDTLASHQDTKGLRRALVASSAGGQAAICVAATRDDVDAVATLAAPASWSFDGLAGDPAELLARFRNIGIIRDPAYPPDRDAWAAEFDTWAAERHVGSIAPRPVLLVHGDADDVVPYPHAERLFDAARAPKELVRIPRGGHQLRRDARALDAVCDWLAGL